jgi:hypothetical protein
MPIEGRRKCAHSWSEEVSIVSSNFISSLPHDLIELFFHPSKRSIYSDIVITFDHPKAAAFRFCQNRLEKAERGQCTDVLTSFFPILISLTALLDP